MKRYRFPFIPLLAALVLLSGCETYPASTTVTSTPMQTAAAVIPANKLLQLNASELIQLFSSTGIPIHIVKSTANDLSFSDDRLTSYSIKEAGKVLLFSSYEEAYSQYKTLLSNNKTSQYIYQNRNVLLILSSQFTKAQAAQYKGIFSIAGDFSDLSLTSSNRPADAVQATTTETATPTPNDHSYHDGTYVIGSLMPAGEYVIKTSGTRCKVTLTQGTKQKHIIYDNSFSNNIILRVHSKEVLTIDGGTAMLLSDCNELDASKEGMFKVGVHITAGTYMLSLSTTNILGFGNVQIMKDSLFREDSILSAELFTEPTSITLKEGQYIKVSGGHLNIH